MRRTPWPRLVLIAGVVAALSTALLRVLEGRGWIVLGPPVLSTVVTLGIAAVVLAMGWNVRQFVKGKRPGTDPIVAARTVALATAAAYTGTLLTGWYAGHVLLVVGDLAIAARRDVAIGAGVALLGAVVLTVAGLVAEHWCEVPPEDDDRGVQAGSTA
ncbi:DUF3180 domain-containing protein [Actinotalea sp. M2MS4P-6]|uniref:DUF3180 domain-containing protein n=1 Tax=Actinotalea sp. M2MS4P-6 TaxID=2983762 RepID=UPI0021E3BB11|nr:DUF3180 domain-containing protein [Actinotalea sp. M2MS4P-6]MCV2394994.1 DUF3180 domain-containing protein [Actinotalea sp. M2MS4P-6]